MAVDSSEAGLTEAMVVLFSGAGVRAGEGRGGHIIPGPLTNQLGACGGGNTQSPPKTICSTQMAFTTIQYYYVSP